MNKFVRMIDVLDLFSASDTLLTAEDIASRLQLSRPTAFRYVRELAATGFLANYSGRYSLGARIITLDYRIRESDPVLTVAGDVMRKLSAETACGSILCRMYNDEIINVHHQQGHDTVGVTFGRGRPLPLFRGAASKAMLANLPTARLRKIVDRHQANPDVQRLGADWQAIKAYFADIRRAGYYMSIQEVDRDTVGLAAPIIAPAVGLVGALSLVFPIERLALISADGHAAMVRNHAREIALRLSSLSAMAGAPE